MTDHEALFAGILANVDADLPRLVFADFLEESGHPAHVARAAFIRAQIDNDTVDWESSTLTTNLQSIMNLKTQFSDEWDEYWGERPRPIRVNYRRGFVDRATVNAIEEKMLSDELWDRAPIRILIVKAHRRMDFNNLRITPEPQAAWDRLWKLQSHTRLRELYVQPLNSAGFRRSIETILRSPTLTGLRKLYLTNLSIDDLHLLSLLSCLRVAEFFHTLESLDLSHNPLTDQAAHALAAMDWPPRLHVLSLAGTRITPQGYNLLRERFARSSGDVRII